MNHKAIRQELEARGWLWQDTSQTHLGYDAIIHKGGRSTFLEIKDGTKPLSQQRLTPHETTVHAKLAAQGITVEIITCSEDLDVLERPQRGRAWG